MCDAVTKQVQLEVGGLGGIWLDETSQKAQLMQPRLWLWLFLLRRPNTIGQTDPSDSMALAVPAHTTSSNEGL